jgi:hypothetical protein
MRTLYALFALSIALTSSPCFAKDALPLKRGVYVVEETPCKGAPLSAVASYQGGKSGISISPMTCDKAVISKTGDGFHLAQTCYDPQANSEEPLDIDITAVSADRFTLDTTVYRYCGKKLAF